MREEFKKLSNCVDAVRLWQRHERDKHNHLDRDLDQVKRRLRVLEELWRTDDGAHKGHATRKSVQASQREVFARDGSTLSKSKPAESAEKVPRPEAAASKKGLSRREDSCEFNLTKISEKVVPGQKEQR